MHVRRHTFRLAAMALLSSTLIAGAQGTEPGAFPNSGQAVQGMAPEGASTGLQAFRSDAPVPGSMPTAPTAAVDPLTGLPMPVDPTTGLPATANPAAGVVAPTAPPMPSPPPAPSMPQAAAIDPLTGLPAATNPGAISAQGAAPTTPTALPGTTAGSGQGPIKQATNGLCLEPGHPLYDSVQDGTRYPTIRACIAQGGRRDVLTDPLANPTAGASTPPSNGMAAIDPSAAAPTPTTPVGAPNPAAPMAPVPGALDPTGAPVVAPQGTATGPMGALPTAEEIARLRAMGVPVDEVMLGAMGVANTVPTESPARTVIGGPKGITLPKQHSYSETPGIFRDPSAYIGRGALDFAP